MIKTFTNVVKFIEGYIPTERDKHPGKAGLERMKYLMRLLGNPHLKYPTIHVGGTSGKGSTATMIAKILSQRYNVGLHTSPHLEKITERIRIIGIKNKYFPAVIPSVSEESSETPYRLVQGEASYYGASRLDPSLSLRMTKEKEDCEDISENEFVRLVNEILPAIEKVEKSKYGRPTYFEITTALAFLAFAKARVDIAVIEVGMGGRYDATNVVKPLVAVLTNVGLEHTDVLGETVEEIARDKVGIVKKRTEVVSAVKQEAVIRITEARSTKHEARLSLLGRDFDYKIKKMAQNGSTFDYFGEETYRNCKLSLLGRHQVENAALAARTVEILRNLEIKELNNKFSIFNFQFSINEIRKGLSLAFIPGRMEIIKRYPLVVLDGAHNPDKMKALVLAIKEIFLGKKVTAVVAVKKGKDAKGMLFLLLPICKKIILTKFKLTTDLGETFSYKPSVMLKLFRHLKKIPKQVRNDVIIEMIDDPLQAITCVVNASTISSPRGSVSAHPRGGFKASSLILVTGSLYLVGEVRKALSVKGKA